MPVKMMGAFPLRLNANQGWHEMMRILTLAAGLFLCGVNAMAADSSKNVLGQPLMRHGGQTATGFYRDGYCRTGADDAGIHVIAAIVTDEFLAFTKTQGNDLQTPRTDSRFPGLKAGDRWCLCAARWSEAEKAGVAPPIDLDATHRKALETVPLETLKRYRK